MFILVNRLVTDSDAKAVAGFSHHGSHGVLNAGMEPGNSDKFNVICWWQRLSGC
jgi:hypothetical protein